MQKRSQKVSFYQQLTSGLLVTVILSSILPTSLFAATAGSNLIHNPNFEGATIASTGEPDGWSKAGFGTNDRNLVYPVPGSNSREAAAITITSYTDGDGKWMFAPVAVISGRQYVYADEYIAGTTTSLIAEFFDASQTHLAYAGFLSLAPSSQSSTSTWSAANATFMAPPGAASMTVFHALAGVGSLTIDNASLNESITPYGTLGTVVAVNGGTLTPKDLTISVSKINSPQVNFVGSASTTALSIDAGDAYSVNTPTFAHYKLTRSLGCSGVLADGENASCLLTQTFLSGTSTTLKIVTKVINTHGRNSQPVDFITTFIGASSTTLLPGSEAGQVVSVIPNTNYHVSVNAGQNYVPSSSTDCVGKLVDGDTTTCEITLSDTPLPVFGGEQPNLIPNPGFEVKDTINPGLPMGWVKGADWGGNVATYVYPVTGAFTSDSDIAVGNAARVSYTSYTGDVLTSGDAKWYFTPVSIFPLHRYKFQDSYHANATTTLVAEFFDSSHTHISLAGFIIVPPSAVNGWKIANTVFAAPVGAAYMTVYHQLNSAGSLTLDNTSLTDETVATAFPQGFVSLTFDDGYVEHAQKVKDILDAASLKGTFYIVSHNSGFGVTNASLEALDPVTPDMPLGWQKLAQANSVFRYPVAGHSGMGAEVSASGTGGGAAWYHTPVSVLDDHSYQFSDFYKSTGKTEVYIEVKSINGQLSYADSDGSLTTNKKPYITLPAANDWKEWKSANVFLPPGSESVKIIHGLLDAGTLTIDDQNFGSYFKSMTPAQIKLLQSEGHEIGGHTQTHADLNSLSGDNAKLEISGGRNDLLSGNMTPVISFAYPYGNNMSAVQRLTQDAGYTTGRGVIDGYNGRDTNRYALFSKSVTADTKSTDIETWINKAILDHTWLILTFHQVNDAEQSAGSPYATSPKILQDIVAYIKANNVSVRTVADGASLMEGYIPLPSATNTPPIIASHENVLVRATTSAGVVVMYTAPTVSDDHGATLSALCTPASGSLFVVGSTTVTCNAKDSSGSAANPTTFVVHVALIGTTTTGDPLLPSVSTSGTSVSSGGGGSFSLYWGCTDQSSNNYNRLANRDDGTCIHTSSASSTTASTTTVSTTTIVSTITADDKGGKNEDKGEVLGKKIYKFNHKLMMGSRGEEVGELQQYLFEKGFYLGQFTGYFGRLTEAAVKVFQRVHGLDLVGYAGPLTRALLNEATFAEVLTATPNTLSTNADIKYYEDNSSQKDKK